MKKVLYGVVIIGIFMNSILFATQESHVHGQAELQVIISETQIEVSLRIPNASMVGFEHAPETELEKAAIERVKLQLMSRNVVSFYEKKGIFSRQSLLNTAIVSKNVALVQENNQSQHDDKHHDNDHHKHHKKKVVDDHDDHHKEHHHEKEATLEGHSKKTSSGHSELHLTLTLSKSAQSQVRLIQTRIFSMFEDIDTLNLTLITHDSQRQETLSKTQTQLAI